VPIQTEMNIVEVVGALAKEYPGLLERLLCIDPDETDAIADEIAEAQVDYDEHRADPDQGRLLDFLDAVEKTRAALLQYKYMVC